MKISIYIPCYNSEKTIEKCIKNLKNQSLKPNEIILVNDGSTDKTTEIAKKCKVKIVNHKTNKGIAEARNTALRASKNNIIAGIDSDTIADKNWLKNLYKTMQKEKAVLVGGKIVENKKTFTGRWRAKHLKQDWKNKKIINPKFIAGNNFLCSKKVFLEIDGYDKKFKTNYEDVDISQRLKEKNYKIVYEPKAEVKHTQKDNVTSVLDRHWRHMLWDYPIPDNVFRKILKIPINLYTTLKFWLSDSLTKAELIPLDIMLFFHHTIKDFRYRK